ncbi:MAG: NYN domain-containing protein [archaeon]|nr:NYN domain-containing protein [archaeon]
MVVEGKRMGVYIDVNNIQQGLLDYNCQGMSLDYSRLIDCIVRGYDLTVLKGYDCTVTDNPPYESTQHLLRNAGVDLVLTESQREEGPNGKTQYRQKEVDTGIVTDVAWDLATGKVDIAVIVSGDRDMRPAVVRARAEGYDVRIVCLESGIGDSFREYLGECTFIEDFEVFILHDDEVVLNTATHSVSMGVTIDG